MPGRVVRVPVAVGDVVAPGTVVAVLEAMKMENDVKSPGGGKVVAIAVSEGAAVEAGALLVQLEAS
jgi:pyruvate carboxylase subunit B